MKRLEADVALSLEGYKTFCKFNSMRNKNYKNAHVRIYIIMAVIFAVTIYMLFNKGFGYNKFIMLAVSGFFGWYYFNALFLAPKKQYVKVKEGYSGKKYVMTEEAFEVYQGEGVDTFYYDDILKVYEIEEYFYVYVTNALCLVVDKSLFTVGTPEEFAEILHENLGSFFISFV